MKLYEITKEYEEITNMVDEDGCITEEGLALLDKNEQDIKEKSKNIGIIFKQYDYDIEILDKEIERLSKMKKSLKTNKDKLKEYLSYNLKKLGIEKIDAGTYKLSFKKSSGVIVDNISDLSKKYITKKVSEVPDKKAIAKAIKEGKKVKGARIEERSNLQIK